MTPAERAELLRQLSRAKAVFMLRAITAVVDARPTKKNADD